MSRLTQGIVLALTMLGVVLAVLLIAELRPPHAECSWQLPKLFSCVISAHEGLAGGLIGAAGTIFAGWLAWVAVRAQIETEKANARGERMRYLREMRDRMARDIEMMENDVPHVDRLVDRFTQNARPGNLPTYLGVMQDAYRHGEIVPTGSTSSLSVEINRCISGLQAQYEIFQGPNLPQIAKDVLAQGVFNRSQELIAIKEKLAMRLGELRAKAADLNARIRTLDRPY